RQAVVRRPVDVEPDDRAGAADVRQRPAGVGVERHRPVTVVAAARLGERGRNVVVRLAEADTEEVADWHLDARARFAIPVYAQHELAMGCHLAAREERHPEALHDAGAVDVEQRRRLAGSDPDEVDVAALAVGTARVPGDATPWKREVS